MQSKNTWRAGMVGWMLSRSAPAHASCRHPPAAAAEQNAGCSTACPHMRTALDTALSMPTNMGTAPTCGSCSSTLPWSLEKRFRMRPVGEVWKKDSGARSTWRAWEGGAGGSSDEHVRWLRMPPVRRQALPSCLSPFRHSVCDLQCTQVQGSPVGPCAIPKPAQLTRSATSACRRVEARSAAM